jgi:hypothetical protein
MNLVVLALTVINVSPALSAPTSYGYGNLAVHDSREYDWARDGIETKESASGWEKPDTNPKPNDPDHKLKPPEATSSSPGPPPTRFPVPYPTATTTLSNWQMGAAGAGGVAAGVIAANYLNQENSGLSSQNQTKRTSEALEGRFNAELIERDLGDHDLDKWVKW